MPDPISWYESWPYIVAALAAGYLLGSIPFGVVLTRFAGLGDIRRIGSGNIGATNVLRTGKKGLALATLLLDGGKGAAAALLADHFFGLDLALAAAGGAFLGHLFPVWLKFKGGKGVATFLGITLALVWQAGIAACLTWLITAAVFRFSSLAALAAAALAPVYAYYWGYQPHGELAIFMAVLIFIRHQANIRRLLRGEEPRIGKGGRDKKTD